MPARPAPMLMMAVAALLIGGCRSYERRPIDVNAVREGWLTRLPSDESARQFAEELARAEGTGPGARFDPSDGLTLAEAEPVALVFNRELRVARLEARVAEAGALHAGLWEDPVIGVDLERILESVSEPWIVAASLGLTLPISGRLEAEKARAGAEFAAELHRIAAREWAVRADVREAWVRWSAQQARAQLDDELLDLLNSIVALADRQESAGVMSRIDARLFRVELMERRAEAEAARAQARELELRLRDLLGLSADAAVEFVPVVSFEPRPVEAGQRRAVMEAHHPGLAASLAEYTVAEETLRLEIREQYPDLTIGPGYKREDGDSRLLLGLSLPAPLWNRNQRGVAEAEAARDVARAKFESLYEELDSRLAVAVARYESARAIRQLVEASVLPLADEQAADVQRAAELGRVDPLLMLATLQSRQGAKVKLLESRAAEAAGAIRLDELLGPPQNKTTPSATLPNETPKADAGEQP